MTVRLNWRLAVKSLGLCHILFCLCFSEEDFSWIQQVAVGAIGDGGEALP